MKNDRLVSYCSRFGYCRLTKLRFRTKRKLGFIKNNVVRCDDATCLQVKTPISTVIGRVAEKNT